MLGNSDWMYLRFSPFEGSRVAIQEASREGVFVTGTPNARFPTHIAEHSRLKDIACSSGLSAKRAESKRKFTLCDEANSAVSLLR